jgi:large subunit ribosomal protein L15
MQIHELQPTHRSKSRKIVGRGGKKGTYSGRGGKGQSARSGRKMVPIIRELIKRYPKLKGYRASSLKNAATVVNLDILEKHAKDGQTIHPKALMEMGLVRSPSGAPLVIKILGKGQITKKITVENCKVSASAKAAIEKAGGKVT